MTAASSTAPLTLLQMAGAPGGASALSDSVLIVIDAQKEYTEGRLPLPGAAAALAAIGRLLARARAGRMPVVHVMHAGRNGSLFDPDGPTFPAADEAVPNPGEVIVRKGLPNAFAGTDLAVHLAATERRNLILCGFMTHMCVDSTARAALDAGFRVTVLSDATATRDLPAAVGGGVVAAADLHRAALTGLSDRFAAIADSADVPD